MRVLKRALAIVYLAAAIVALGTLVCQFWGPYTYRFMLLMRDAAPRIVVTVCAGVVALGVLMGFFRLMFAANRPACIRRGSAISRSRLRLSPRVPVLLPNAMIA